MEILPLATCDQAAQLESALSRTAASLKAPLILPMPYNQAFDLLYLGLAQDSQVSSQAPESKSSNDRN
ncbi:hypothetical protein MKW98_009540 [Papaver atlanticum]|uniref:Uncharacterized protein n=1 Tax=Papaver atlanticum TaxID=357466 RepID=A0AAD4XF23_9MAGN|nr:hypothetical protein MKW98_009540 [Papaver atlanticum]